MSAFRPSYVITAGSSTGGGTGGGSADGKSRVYQFRSDSQPNRVIEYALYPWQGPVPTGVFDLTDAKTGDALTVLVESMPFGNYTNAVFVIPQGFTGSIAVSSQFLGSYYFVTEASLMGQAYDLNTQNLPGVQPVGPGLTQLLVLERPTISGDLIAELVSLTKAMKTVYNITWSDKANAAYDQAFLTEVLTNNRGSLYLESMAPFSVRVFSNRSVRMTMRIRTWSTENKNWDNIAGEYEWTTQDDGRADWNSIGTIISLPTVQVPGSGTYSLIPQDARIELSMREPIEPGDLLTFDGFIQVLGDFTQS